MTTRRYISARTLLSAGLTAALLATPISVMAQDDAPPSTVGPPAAPQNGPAPEEFNQAIRVLAVMNSAFGNDQVNEITKGKLFDCMFSNSLRVINTGVQATFKDNPELSFDNDVHLFRVVTAICGVTTDELKEPVQGGSATVEPVPPQAPVTEGPGR